MPDMESLIVRNWLRLRGLSYIMNDAGVILVDQSGVLTGTGRMSIYIDGFAVEYGSVVADIAGTTVNFPNFDNTNYFFRPVGYKDGEGVEVSIGTHDDGTKLVGSIVVYPVVDQTNVSWFAIGARTP